MKIIKIPATKGTQTIARAKDVFTGYIDSNFLNWNTGTASMDTQESNVEVHDLEKNGTFIDMFGENPNCLTQSQIIEFCKNNKEELSEYYTFFPFKEDDKFFVASVLFGSGWLGVGVSHFSDDNVWHAEYRHRFVIPQLNPSDTQDFSLRPLETLTLESALKMVVDAGYTISKTNL
jgi:hypothetical protein